MFMNSMLKWLGLSLLIIVLDLWTKSIASANLTMFQPVPVFPGFNFTLMHNRGAAFSFLSDASGWQRWFFTIVALVVSVVIVVWMHKLKPHERLTAIALAMILGGALGNVWDRITLGYVVDFIDVYYGDAHWPAFNIADSAISVGVVLYILDTILESRRATKQAKTEHSSN